MKIGVAREIKPDEYRVALTPAGARELEEETGLRGGVWERVTAFWTTPGFCNERMYVFFAEQLERGEPGEQDADEDIEIVRIPRADIGARLGEIEDAKTLVGLLLYLSRSDKAVR